MKRYFCNYKLGRQRTGLNCTSTDGFRNGRHGKVWITEPRAPDAYFLFCFFLLWSVFCPGRLSRSDWMSVLWPVLCDACWLIIESGWWRLVIYIYIFFPPGFYLLHRSYLFTRMSFCLVYGLVVQQSYKETPRCAQLRGIPAIACCSLLPLLLRHLKELSHQSCH